MKLNNVISLLFVCMLSACAASAPEYDEKLSQQDAAASIELKQIFFEKLSYGEERREFFTLNMLHQFNEGKSVYRAFELPEFNHAYQVTIRSRLYTDKGKKQLFLPIIEKLDEDFRPTEKYRISESEAAEAVSHLKPLEINVRVDAKDRYLIIHSAPEIFQKNILPDSTSSPVFARAGNLDIAMPLKGADRYEKY